MLKKVKAYFKKACVSSSVYSLSMMAGLFAMMYCNGKIYEPRVPEKLQQK